MSNRQEAFKPTAEEIANALVADGGFEIWPCKGCGVIHLRLYDKTKKLIVRGDIDPLVWHAAVEDVYDQILDDIGAAGLKH